MCRLREKARQKQNDRFSQWKEDLLLNLTTHISHITQLNWSEVGHGTIHKMCLPNHA